MMKSLKYLVLVAIVGLSSCFNITEEIFLQQNGSGKYVTTIDIKQLMDMVDMLKNFSPDMFKNENIGDNPLAQLDSIPQLMGKMEAIPGITDIKQEKIDKSTYTVSFNFKNIKALNELLKKRNNSPRVGDMYTFTPGNLVCNDTTANGIKEALNKLMPITNNDSLAFAMTMVKGMLGDMTYKTVMHLPGKVIQYSNKSAVLEADGKTLSNAIKPMDESVKNSSLQNKVKFQMK
jgi:hypothetical protein